MAQAESALDELEQAYQAAQRQERPHSQLARARARVTQLTKRIQRGRKTVETYEQKAHKLDATVARLETERQALAARRAELEVDNQTNPNPVTIQIRVDAGFGSGAEIAWLIEMGYIVYTKAYSDKVSQAHASPLPGQTPCGRASARTPR